MAAIRRSTGDHHRAVRSLTDPLPEQDPRAAMAAWAASGAMALTGRPGASPLGPPTPLVPRATALGHELAAAAGALGASVEVSPLELLGERAAIAGLHRRGSTSVGGATRLLRAGDGAWMAVSLARPDDVELLPAWLETDVRDDPWPVVERAAHEAAAAALVERARLLGLPASVLGEAAAAGRPPVRCTVSGTAAPVRAIAEVRVVELASLWAGPLCGSLLRGAGATVVKVESVGRPDGARRGPPAFFDLLNAGKRSVAVDLTTAAGRGALIDELRAADVVIEGSRPRALEQLGIDAESLVTSGDRPRAWLSITGHGRTGSARDWVAFGDDAAVAGGLVAQDDRGPVFCADAVADPLTGVAAAVAVLESLATSDRVVLDVALSAVAAAFAGPVLPVPEGTVAAEPRSRAPSGRGPQLGEHGSA
jgi:hypothetical protein